MQRYKILFGKISLVVKTVKATVIGLVANSLPGNEVILLTLLISNRYIPYTDLPKFLPFPIQRKDRSLPIEWVFLYIEKGAFYMLRKHLSENRAIQQVLTI